MRCPARHTNPGNCPRQFHGNKGGTTPEKFVSRSSTSCLLNFPYLKKFEKGLKENLKKSYNKI
jgi:hypothetical protein